MKKTIMTNRAPMPIGPYSQGVTGTGRLLFTSGQIALDPKTNAVAAADIRAQTRIVLDNLQAVLTEGGAQLSSVVKTTVYLKNMADFPAMNEVYAEYFRTGPPARSTVEVARLPKDVLVEIDCIALIPE